MAGGARPQNAKAAAKVVRRPAVSAEMKAVDRELFGSCNTPLEEKVPVLSFEYRPPPPLPALLTLSYCPLLLPPLLLFLLSLLLLLFLLLPPPSLLAYPLKSLQT